MYYCWSKCKFADPMLPGYEDREVVEDLTIRPLPPEDIFCFPLVDTWRKRIWRILADVVTDEVKAEFVRNPPEYVVSDDLSWLDDLVFKMTGVTVDMKELTA